MRLNARKISSGMGNGEVLRLKDPFSFLGGVDGSTGKLNVESGENVKGKILVFPRGKGSTVGSFTMYDLKVHGAQPAAVINASAETIVATGAVISSIPMVDRVDVDLFMTGDRVTVDADAGYVDIDGVQMIETVSSIVLFEGKILMLKRPDSSRSYPGVWSFVSGKIEPGESPDEAAIREIMEETGIKIEIPKMSMNPIMLREGNTIWNVHPFLFISDTSDVTLNRENEDSKWVDVDEIQSMKTVPQAVSTVRDMLRISTQVILDHRL